MKLHQAPAHIPAHRPGPEEEQHGRKRSIRKRHRNLLITKILIGWIALMAVIVVATRRIAGKDDAQDRGRNLVAPPGGFAEEDTAFLQKVISDCGTCLIRFLSSGTPEERNQYVRQPIVTAGKMARFYAMNPFTTVDTAAMKLKSQKLIRLAAGHAVATVWSMPDGRTLDAVFFQEEGEWRLDWDQFVRYSDYPWPLFVSGSGGDSGEFRLLARQRASTTGGDSGPLSLTLYAPRFGYPTEPGQGSPEIELSRSSADARLLMSAFRGAKKGVKPFDGKIADEDPEGMIRVRAKIHRTRDDHGNFHFEVEKVIACHWISSDEPGVVALTEEELNRAP